MADSPDKTSDNSSESSSKLLSYDQYQEKVKNLKTMSDVNNFVQDLIAPTLQAMLEGELTNHLGYAKYDKEAKKERSANNSRNGYSPKNVKTSFGTSELKIPRDREGRFEPLAVRKYETVDNAVEEKIVSMYAKGMTTRDINQHMRDIYGVEVSSSMVSNITDKVMPLVQEWQVRPLESIYAIVYLDGIHFKVRDSGRIINKCAYTALGIDKEGRKELLGIWIQDTEGSKFWLAILNELKNRGVEDILICCIDGLKGFSDAIKTIYPETDIQQCIVHQVRNSMKYIPHRFKKKFCADLKTIYTAANEEAGFTALQEMKKKWPQYEVFLKSWEVKWPELATFFSYPQQIRKLIYTTNSVESLHHQMRKATKTTTIFPSDEALMKLLWLAQRDMTKKWQPIPGWGDIMAQFAIMFPERVKV